MYYILNCDLSTLHCTSMELEQLLRDFSSRYHRVNDHFWLFCAPKSKTASSFVAPNEYFITHILRKFTDQNSVLFSAEIPKSGYYYELPEDATAFLEIDDEDD